MFYTYSHAKPDGTIFYIGKGQGKRAWAKKGRNNYWHNVVNKYKEYKVQILAEWNTEEEAFDHETLLISCLRDMDIPLVNMTDGGEGVSGYVHSEESKNILRQNSLKNGAVERCIWMANDPEIKQKRIKANTGKKHSLGSKENMSKAKDNVKRSFVVCGKTFESIHEFARKTNSFQTTIRRWLNAGDIDKLEERYNAANLP